MKTRTKPRHRRVRFGPRRRILLGTDPFTRRPVRLPPEIRQYGLHIIGAPGRGKSKFLEWLIRRDIENGDGVCVIDPHGSLYTEIVKWCAANEMFRKRKIILMDLSADEWAFGFNPLNFGITDEEGVSDALAGVQRAISQVWGGEDLTQKPEIAGALPVLLHTLWVNGLTLPDAVRLCRPGPFLEAALQKVIDPAMREEWNNYLALGEQDFVQRLYGPRNRFRDFNTSPALRTMLGQTGAVLDLKRAMDESAVVLVNLGKLSEDNKRRIGTLFQADIHTKGIQREPDVSPPFYVYLDECYYFVNEDTERILDGLRKFRVHLILAHHRMSQLERAGESAVEAVMQISNKVVFGGVTATDAEALVDPMFIDEIDYQESKERFERPVQVGVMRTWFKSESSGSSSGSTSGRASGRASTTTRGSSRSVNDDGDLLSATSADAYASAISELESWSATDGSSHTEGISEGLMPIFEKLGTIPYSLPEQIKRAMARLMTQHERHAVAKLTNRKTASIYTPTVGPPLTTDKRARTLSTRNYAESGVALLKAEAKRAIEDRQRRLLQDGARRKQLKEHPPEPDEWEE